MNEQEIVESVSSAATDVAESVVPEVIETVEVIRNNPYILSGVAVVSLGIGAGIGYFVANRVLKTRYEEIADREIEEAKDYYSVLHKEGEYSTPESAQEAMKAHREYSRESFVVESDDQATVVTTTKTEVDRNGDDVEENKTVEHRNIFVNNTPIDESEYPDDDRPDDRPFVISMEEFMENPHDFESYAMTYYMKDDVLAGEDEKDIPNSDEIVGDTNLTKFGHLSKDPNMVYICNPVNECIFEVARSTGSYAHEVLGLDEPDDEPRVLKFRGGDD